MLILFTFLALKVWLVFLFSRLLLTKFEYFQKFAHTKTMNIYYGGVQHYDNNHNTFYIELPTRI